MINIIFSFLSLTAAAQYSPHNGNYHQSVIDVYFHPEFPLTRHFNSQSSHQGLFGLGWCSNIETKLSQIDNATLEINYCGDGQILTFNKYNSTTWQNKNNPIDTITKTASGWERKPTSQSIETYNLKNGLLSKISTSDFSINFQYDLSIRQITIEQDQNIYTLVLNQKNLVTSIKELPQIKYQYDAFNKIISNTNFWNTQFNFNYFSSNQLRKIEMRTNTERKSKTFLELSYYPDKKIKSVTTANGCTLAINTNNESERITGIVSQKCQDKTKNYDETFVSIIDSRLKSDKLITHSYKNLQTSWTKEYSSTTGLMVKQIYNQNEYIYSYQPPSTLKSITSANTTWVFEKFDKRCALPLRIKNGTQLNQIIYQASCLPSQISTREKNYLIKIDENWQIEAIKINGEWLSYQVLDNLELAPRQLFLDALIAIEDILLPIKLAKDLRYE